MAAGGTAEEFYSRCQSHAAVLDAAARAFAAHGETVDAVACAWGADLAGAQAVLWERIVVGSRTPVRRYYQAGEAVTRALAQHTVEDAEYPDTSAEHAVAGARRRYLRAFDERLSREIETRLPSLAYLSGIVAPTESLIAQSVSRRLLGLPASAFVESRLADAAAAMAAAHERAADDVEMAIRHAYDSDAWSLSAYLVESALAVGDEALLTVTTRWELVNAGLESLTSLPADFAAAVAVLRATVDAALGEADGARLREVLVTV